MRVLIFIHRWLGIRVCLLFAMWFATGIVIHFVPFPALTEAERIRSLSEIDLAGVTHGPADALRASKLQQATRVRLWQRTDGPVYLVSTDLRATSVRAADLSSAKIATADWSL